MPIGIWKNRKREPLSKEHKEKLSKSHKKNPIRYWLGKKMSKETRKKFSELRKKAGIRPPSRKGMKMPDEWIQKRREIKGEMASNWKGGITPLVRQIRGCFKYRQWRSDIFTRDDYTCVVCGLRGVYLEADHYPKTFSQIFQESKVKTLEEAENYEEFWNINNGRTVCKKHNPRGSRMKAKLVNQKPLIWKR